MWFNKNKQSILALAPLADHTDSPFCRVCRKVSKEKSLVRKILRFTQDDKSDFVIFREMVSAEAIVRGSEKTLKMCEFKKSERPIVIQIFGSNAETITKAAKIIVQKFKPDGIDINMGCPVPKIVKKSNSGATLMKDHGRACEIVKSLKKADLGVPVSVKTRLGWDREDEILELAPKLEKAGVDLITIHGRTKKQGYIGQANWEMIGRVKEKLNIPVLTNGDVVDKESLAECLKITKADGVMIGRGALGNPWIFRSFAPLRMTNTTVQDDISLKERIRVVLYHAKMHEKHYGPGSLVTFRKHLMWYFKGSRVGMNDIKKIRQKLAQIKTRKELKIILKSLV